MVKIGRLSEPFETGGGDPEVYKDYAKSFEDASNRMLAKVSKLPGFKILSCKELDVGKWYWAYAELTYSYQGRR